MTEVVTELRRDATYTGIEPRDLVELAKEVPAFTIDGDDLVLHWRSRR
jgi:hypothetical protein